MKPNALAGGSNTRSTRNLVPQENAKASSSKQATPEQPQYQAWNPGMAKKSAGHETPPSMAFGRQDSASESMESLLPKPPKAKRGIDRTEDIPLQDMSSKARGKRRETPVDPHIQAHTKGYAPLNGRERMAEIPLNSPLASPRTSTDSTDPFGLPLPVTTGKGKKKQAKPEGTIREQVAAEEQAIQKGNKKKGLAAGAALLTLTLGGAAVSTLKDAGKL